MDNENTPLPVVSSNKEIKKRNFERRLISHVRRQQFIYDSRHRYFSDAAKEEAAWTDIAQKLNSDADTCKKRWTELRYKYQYYVYRLRYNFLNNQKENYGKQSAMYLDSELICLFKFMDNPKYFPIPHEIIQAVQREEQLQATKIDDDLILLEKPTELIVINEDDDNNNNNTEETFKVTKEMTILVEHIIKYPELYDSTLPDYNDYTRKSFIWNAIAIDIGAKSTKLMKFWILMMTRYEWEISNTPRRGNGAPHQTELLKLLLFFEPYILANPDTVCKQSFYLKDYWHEPLYKVKDIHNLIVRMRQVPHVVHTTDSLLYIPAKSDDYFKLWTEIASMQCTTVGQCETTWLTMRLFYWELIKMRQQNYHLGDKWYFERFITDLYEVSQKSQRTKQQKRHKSCHKQSAKVNKTEGRRSKTALGNSAGNNNKKGITVKPIETLLKSSVPSVASSTVPPPLLLYPQREQPPPVASTVPSLVHSQPQSEQMLLPKITSAISLAPKNLPPVTFKGSVLIRQIGPETIAKVAPTPTPLQKVEKQTDPPAAAVQLPFKLPKDIKVSKVTKSSTVTATQASPPPLVISNARSVMYPSGNIIIPDITITRTKATTRTTRKIPPKPIICINVVKSTPKLSPNAADVSRTSPTAAMPPLVAIPKISSAVSLFNPNEISIEVRSSAKGEFLYIEHPPLNENYTLAMPIVVKFIRAALAVPLLHYKRHTEGSLINGYWEHISNKFDLPAHICQACWNFLEGCFFHFAPIKELMKPFHTTQIVWTQSFELFQLFDQHAVFSGWLEYAPLLPEVIACIARYPCLYKDVEKNSKVTNSDVEASGIWDIISARFPNISHICTIWISFKNVFCQYMSNIELGIDDKWHMHWWRVLAKLTFLVETRYSCNEPYYYIVSNKMMEEIQRCALIGK